MQKINIFHLCHMKSYEAEITFHQETWHQICLSVMLLALQKATAKSYFLHIDIWLKTLLYYIIRTIALERFHIVTHSYVVSFSIRMLLMKLTTFFVSKTKQIYTKTLTVPESAFEIKAMLPLQTKTFALKRYCAISSILQIPRYWSRSFDKAPTSFYTCHERRLPYNSPCIFDGPFNFKLLFTTF